jgi:hypothetical protein
MTDCSYHVVLAWIMSGALHSNGHVPFTKLGLHLCIVGGVQHTRVKCGHPISASCSRQSLATWPHLLAKCLRELSMLQERRYSR